MKQCGNSLLGGPVVCLPPPTSLLAGSFFIRAKKSKSSPFALRKTPYPPIPSPNRTLKDLSNAHPEVCVDCWIQEKLEKLFTLFSGWSLGYRINNHSNNTEKYTCNMKTY